MKIIFKIMILIIIAQIFVMGQDLNKEITTNYTETIDDILTKFTYIEQKTSSGYAIEFHKEDRIEKCITDSNYSCQRWEYENSKNNTKFIAVRVNDTIQINGILNGDIIDKLVEIENPKWFQFWEYGIKNMFKSDTIEMRFTSFDSNKLNDGATFIVEREDDETIRLNNAEINTHYITVSIKGLPSFLFEADFWFEKTTNQFLRSEMPQGPFASTTITELAPE